MSEALQPRADDAVAKATSPAPGPNGGSGSGRMQPNQAAPGIPFSIGSGGPQEGGGAREGRREVVGGPPSAMTLCWGL